MSDYTLSPNMSLPVPTVSEAPGPGWATNIDASLGILDSHNHSSGQGIQINPSGINVNTDFPFNSNNATVVRSVNFATQTIPLALATDIGCLYVSGVDLYYNDENGNQIRITQSGSVAGSAGTITGLPSGSASASYSAGTFTFQGATNTPATIAVGPIVLGNNVVNSKTVTISPNSGIAANYNLTLPSALPGSANYVTLDNSGNLGFNSSGFTGSNAIVLATSPTITTPSFPSGAVFSSGTLTDYVDATFVPSVSFSSGSGTITPSTGHLCKYRRTGNIVEVWLRLIINTPAAAVANITLPVLPNNNWNFTTQLFNINPSGSGGFTPVCTIGAKTVTMNFPSATSGTIAQYIFMYYLDN